MPGLIFYGLSAIGFLLTRYFHLYGFAAVSGMVISAAFSAAVLTFFLENHKNRVVFLPLSIFRTVLLGLLLQIHSYYYGLRDIQYQWSIGAGYVFIFLPVVLVISFILSKMYMRKTSP